MEDSMKTDLNANTERKPNIWFLKLSMLNKTQYNPQKHKSYIPGLTVNHKYDLKIQLLFKNKTNVTCSPKTEKF